jgi:hypothetical protein
VLLAQAEDNASKSSSAFRSGLVNQEGTHPATSDEQVHQTN